jgi:hypothetical protein
MIRVMPHNPTMGENYLLNADAEDPLTNTWGAYFGCPRVQTAEDKHGGTYSMKYTTNSAVNPQGAIQYHFRLQAFGTFQGSAWVKGPVGVKVAAKLRLHPTASEVAYAEYTLTGDWQFIQSLPFSLTGKAFQPSMPAMEAVLTTAGVGQVLYVDDASVVQISTV